MKRAACRLLICVLLGVVINLAVAAVCTWRSGTPWFSIGLVEDDAWITAGEDGSVDRRQRCGFHYFCNPHAVQKLDLVT